MMNFCALLLSVVASAGWAAKIPVDNHLRQDLVNLTCPYHFPKQLSCLRCSLDCQCPSGSLCCPFGGIHCCRHAIAVSDCPDSDDTESSVCSRCNSDQECNGHLSCCQNSNGNRRCCKQRQPDGTPTSDVPLTTTSTPARGETTSTTGDWYVESTTTGYQEVIYA